MNRIDWWREKVASQSLKKKWAISSATVIFLSFAIMSLILFVSLKSWLYQQEELEVNRTMQDLSSFFEAQGMYLTVKDIQENTTLMTSIIDKDQTVRLLNTDGIELLQINDTSSFPIFNDRDIPSNGYVVHAQGSESISAIGHIQLGRFNGYIQLEHPLRSFQSMMSYIGIAMLLFSICALLLSGMIGYSLASFLLKPLKELKMKMNDVASFGFEKELQIPYDTEDEIGELIAVYESMMSKLKTSFEQQQQFMADASHELRTPLQGIEGHLSLLNRWGKNDPVVLEESLSIALQEVQHLKTLIDEMLELARGEQSSDRPLTNIVQQTDKVINEIIGVHSSAYIEHIHPSNDEMEVHISSNAYQQIIRNILINAIRYSENSAQIIISYERTVSTIEVQVKDQGVGIGQEHINKIFDRFYRVDMSRSRHLGSGLGLSIVKMLIEHANGTIHVTSEVGRGSIFTLVFPI